MITAAVTARAMFAFAALQQRTGTVPTVAVFMRLAGGCSLTPTTPIGPQGTRVALTFVATHPFLVNALILAFVKVETLQITHYKPPEKL
jgi:hypothetical protein